MSQLLLTHRRLSHHRDRFRNPIPFRLRAGRFFLMFSMIFLGGLMSMLYLIHFTDIHTKGYQLRRLELEREVLRKQQEIKTMNLAKVRSLEHVESSGKVIRMVPSRNPIYLKSDQSVARR